MLRIETHDGVICAGGTASLLGTSIPVWLYLVDDLLVDTGPSALKKPLVEFFSEHRIGRAALTHRHEDHSGLAGWLQKEQGAEILASSTAVTELARPARLPLYRRLIWGKRPGVTAWPLPGRIDTTSHSLRVLQAPGHSPDHVALFEPERGWLFSGDLFVRTKPRLAFIEEDMTLLMQSLESLLNLDFKLLFCAHAGVRLDGPQALEDKLSYLQELRRTIADLRAEGMSNAAIAGRLFPKKPPVVWLSRGEWSALNLVRTL